MKSLLLILFLPYVASTQTTIYSGGIGSGYSSFNTTSIQCKTYIGGSNAGFSTNNSPLTVCPSYFGGIGDGFGFDSTNMCSTILSLKTLTLTGQKDGLKNIIQWNVYDWATIKKFEIESSANGIVYTSIGTVYFNGNNTYSIIDLHPYEDITVYRIKIIEINNNTSYSTLLVIRSTISKKLLLFPNPTNGNCSVTFNTHKELNTFINCYDSKGVLVHSQKVNIKKGNNVMQLDFTNLANGIYLLKISGINLFTAFLIAK